VIRPNGYQFIDLRTERTEGMWVGGEGGVGDGRGKGERVGRGMHN